MTVRSTAEALLCGTRLYRPARNAYQRTLNREHYRKRLDDRRFMRNFVRTNDLVFDVGANTGLMTELYLELGARVVAVEPDPRLSETISRRFAHRRLTVEPRAVGAEPGEATLHIGAQDIHSTISDEWLTRIRRHPALPDRWVNAIRVPVTTLDELVERHGTPAFLKLDIEGHEHPALSALSHPIRAVSFEYNCPALDFAAACLERLSSLGDYRYRYAPGEELRFADPTWVGPKDLMAELERLRELDPHTHGDIYAIL